MLKRDLAGKVPDDAIGSMPNGFESIGDIAIVSLNSEALKYKEAVVEAIKERRPYIRTVLNKASKLEGERRVARYEALAGEETITTHREFGFEYTLDVRSSFFNPRLATERQRVAGMVIEGEDVLIPFSGVGPFAIPVAARRANAYAIELNPEACGWHAHNARLNHVMERTTIINGNAFKLPLKMKFDRIIVPTPYGMDDILYSLTPFLKKGGMMHFYTFKKKCQIEGLLESYDKKGLAVKGYKKCGNVAPGVSRWAFDLFVIGNSL